MQKTISPSAVMVAGGLDRNSLRALRCAFQVLTTYPRAQRRRDLISLMHRPLMPR